MQKSLIEAMDLDRPKVSLWVHGRTTIGICKEVENGILSWISIVSVYNNNFSTMI